MNKDEIRLQQLEGDKPEDCYCDEEVNSTEYTYSDKYGACDICEEDIKVKLLRSKI